MVIKMRDYSKVGLYDHNIKSYEKVNNAYLNGENIVGIIQATGTGKTYQALQLALDNKDKNILYVAPSNAIIEHIESIIENNPNLDKERDFPNLKFITYQSLISKSREELKDMNVDILILDEFHHIGAPVWGSRVSELIKTHDNLKIFGMTAYSVRDRNTPYERDMTNPDTDELFSSKIVNRYDLIEAMIDEVLPIPVYKSCCINLLGIHKYLEDKINDNKLSYKEYQEYLKILKEIKMRIDQALNIKDIIHNYVKKDGKYIYFCPIGTDMDEIIEEAKEWFKDYDVVFYRTESKDGKIGKINRDAFYHDRNIDGSSAKEKLRIIFTKNQYNEGVHSPEVDGVILGRYTLSDIVYFEQIGRALTVCGSTLKLKKYYETLSIEDLKVIANKKDIKIESSFSKAKIINRLIAPVIIDLSGNIDFIKELEDNLQYRIKEYRKQNKNHNERDKKEIDYLFDIEILNEDLYKVLTDLKNRLKKKTWEDMYLLALNYFNHYDNLEIRQDFKTFNGVAYDCDGYNLGTWISNQRTNYKKGKLSKEKIELLLKIKMRFLPKNNQKYSFDDMYKLAKTYYEFYGNIDVSKGFKTINGYQKDENGVNLHNWVNNQTSSINRKEFELFMRNREKLDDTEKDILGKLKVITDSEYIDLLSIGIRSGGVSTNISNNKKIFESLKVTDKNQIDKLRKRSTYELKALIAFLMSNNLPVVENGKLNKIFFMPGFSIKTKYKISKSDIIKNYLSNIAYFKISVKPNKFIK